jgi:hypothetical protein
LVPTAAAAKADLFRTFYGTTEAVPYKDFTIATQTLQPGWFPFDGAISEKRQAEACPT